MWIPLSSFLLHPPLTLTSKSNKPNKKNYPKSIHKEHIDLTTTWMKRRIRKNNKEMNNYIDQGYSFFYCVRFHQRYSFFYHLLTRVIAFSSTINFSSTAPNPFLAVWASLWCGMSLLCITMVIFILIFYKSILVFITFLLVDLII